MCTRDSKWPLTKAVAVQVFTVSGAMLREVVVHTFAPQRGRVSSKMYCQPSFATEHVFDLKYFFCWFYHRGFFLCSRICWGVVGGYEEEWSWFFWSMKTMVCLEKRFVEGRLKKSWKDLRVFKDRSRSVMLNQRRIWLCNSSWQQCNVSCNSWSLVKVLVQNPLCKLSWLNGSWCKIESMSITVMRLTVLWQLVKFWWNSRNSL